MRAQVGAVIVGPDDRVVATGYNGPPAGTIESNELCDTFCTRAQHGPTSETLVSYEDCPSIHAELNAIVYSDRSLREDGTLYVTGSMCFTCAKVVSNSGLYRVVIGPDRRGYRDPGSVESFMRDRGLEVVHL